MCDFCTFEYGVAKTSISKIEGEFQVVHEIRPNISGQFMYFVRVLKGNTIVVKTVVFIEYCPMCGGNLKSFKLPVIESNEEGEIKLNNLGTTMYKEDGTFKDLTEILDDIGGMNK